MEEGENGRCLGQSLFLCPVFSVNSVGSCKNSWGSPSQSDSQEITEVSEEEKILAGFFWLRFYLIFSVNSAASCKNP